MQSIQQRNGRALGRVRLLSGAGLAAALTLGLGACDSLSIVDRCARAHPRGTQGYQECVRSEQAEAERIRARSLRQFPGPNLP